VVPPPSGVAVWGWETAGDGCAFVCCTFGVNVAVAIGVNALKEGSQLCVDKCAGGQTFFQPLPVMWPTFFVFDFDNELSHKLPQTFDTSGCILLAHCDCFGGVVMMFEKAHLHRVGACKDDTDGYSLTSSFLSFLTPAIRSGAQEPAKRMVCRYPA
jgi:hypothetical protein